MVALVAIAVHGGSLMGDAWLRPGLAGITIPFALHYRPGFTGLGIIAGYLAVLLGPTFYLRRRIGTRMWRRLHRLTPLIWMLAAVHTLGSGSDASSLWLRCVVAHASRADRVPPHGPHVRRASAPGAPATGRAVAPRAASGPGRRGRVIGADTRSRCSLQGAPDDLPLRPDQRDQELQLMQVMVVKQRLRTGPGAEVRDEDRRQRQPERHRRAHGQPAAAGPGDGSAHRRFGGSAEPGDERSAVR